MLIMKLNLPEATVTYNNVGVCTSIPVPHTPDRIKATRLTLSITGYVGDEGFFAYRATCPEKAMVLGEQLTLLKQLGFRTVPTAYDPKNAASIDDIIRTKLRYAKYDAEWFDHATGKLFAVPELAKIEDFTWVVDGAGRVCRRIITDKGEFDILDQRMPEAYQVGLEVKIWNGKVEPYTTGPIVDPVLTHCPKCNNPLKRLQLSADLPVILKCVNPVCKLIKVEEPAPKAAEPITPKEPVMTLSIDPDPAEVPYKLTDPVSTDDVAVPNKPISIEETTKPVEVAAPTCINIEGVAVPEDFSMNVMYDSELVDELTPEDCTAQNIICVLRKSKRSTTNASKKLANRLHIPLLTVDEVLGTVKEDSDE